MARSSKKKSPTNRPPAASSKTSKKAGKKKGSKKVGRAKKEAEPEEKDEDAIDVDDDEGDDESDDADEDEDEGDDDEDEDDDDDADEGAGSSPRERDKSPIAKRMAKRLAKALSGLRKRHATISEWREAGEISTDLAAGISSIEDAIAKLNEKPDDYKPKDRRPRAKHEFKEGDRVKISGKKSREMYEDIFGADAIDNLRILRVKGKQVVVEHGGHKQVIPTSCLAPAEAS